MSDERYIPAGAVQPKDAPGWSGKFPEPRCQHCNDRGWTDSGTCICMTPNYPPPTGPMRTPAPRPLMSPTTERVSIDDEPTPFLLRLGGIFFFICVLLPPLWPVAIFLVFYMILMWPDDGPGTRAWEERQRKNR